MKKAISLVLAVIFICSFAPCAFAEAKKFDYKSALGDRDGYSYDKFDKSWSYYGAYAEYFSDATVIIGIQTESNSGESNPALTTLYVKIIDKNGDKLHDVESIDFLIGEDIYSYESMLPLGETSAVVLAEDGLLLIKAIKDSDSKDVAIRLGVKNKGNVTFDDLDSSEYKELKDFCRVYLKYDLWDYCADKDTANYYESLFPLTINGEPIEHEDEAA